jgi:hypothetical protein
MVGALARHTLGACPEVHSTTATTTAPLRQQPVATHMVVLVRRALDLAAIGGLSPAKVLSVSEFVATPSSLSRNEEPNRSVGRWRWLLDRSWDAMLSIGSDRMGSPDAIGPNQEAAAERRAPSALFLSATDHDQRGPALPCRPGRFCRPGFWFVGFGPV